MNKKFKLEKVLELREKALEREKITLADLQLKEKQAYEEMYAVMEDIKAKILSWSRIEQRVYLIL